MPQPLFPDDSKPDPRDNPSGVHLAALRTRHTSQVQPVSKNLEYQMPIAKANEAVDQKREPAIEIIRHKLDAVYAEQDASEHPRQQPQAPAARADSNRSISKHQAYMQALSTSGKPLAQIQAEWHNYYVNLPDKEKYEVWQEFYDTNKRTPGAYNSYASQRQPSGMQTPADSTHSPAPVPVVAPHTPLPSMPTGRHKKSAARLHHKITKTVKEQVTEPKKLKEHAHSLLFGLGTGAVVLVITLFGFFNEMVIAPFLQPSRNVQSSQIIIGGDSLVAGETPEVIIPKINVQIPVVYDTNSTSEAVIQDALENGVVHYSTTVMPGEKGNSAIFGHSSNNIFNKGKYKFAFVLLHKLEPGDIFYLTYDKKVYTYKVFNKRIVPPEEISVMDAVPDKTATVTLITCDPPGTSTNRLVVWGEQINPKPSTATEPTNPQKRASDNTSINRLQGQSQSLWDRIIHWDF